MWPMIGVVLNHSSGRGTEKVQLCKVDQVRPASMRTERRAPPRKNEKASELARPRLLGITGSSVSILPRFVMVVLGGRQVTTTFLLLASTGAGEWQREKCSTQLRQAIH